MAEKICINIKDGNVTQKSFDFEKTKIVVGRDPKNDLVIDDIEISRKHLVISKKGDAYFAEDQKSTNGTFIDGKRIAGKVELNSGDLITLGEKHVLEFVLESTVEEIQNEILESEEKKSPETFEKDKVELDTTDESIESQSAVKKSKDEKKKKTPKENAKRPTWLIVLLAALAFIVIFCVIPFIVIEVTNQWCDLFAGFFNSMSPGVCP